MLNAETNRDTMPPEGKSSVESGLRLEVRSQIGDIQEMLPGYQGSRYVASDMVVRSLVRNVSDHAITLPTETYDHASALTTASPTASLVRIFVMFPSSVRQPVVPSPYRYYPVTLLPGQCTMLPEPTRGSRIPIKAIADRIETVTVEYQVDTGLAAQNGWWSGQLRATCKVERAGRKMSEPADSGGEQTER